MGRGPRRLAGCCIVWRGAESVGTSELVMVFAFLGLLAAVVAVLVASPHFKTETSPGPTGARLSTCTE